MWSAIWPMLRRRWPRFGTRTDAEYSGRILRCRRKQRQVGESRTGQPWVLEQPPGRATSRMKRLYGAPTLTLCGEMFGLGVLRHRNFWIDGVKVVKPKHVPHRGRVSGMRHGVWYQGPYFAVYGEGGGKGSVAEWRKAMGIDWTWERKSIAEAIPPAYTEYIAQQIIKEIS